MSFGPTVSINQPVEVPALRPKIVAELGFGNQRPDLVVQFGRPRSFRRPLSAVITPP